MHPLRNLSLTLVAFLALTSLLTAKTLVNVDRSGIGIRGYDPIAYFTDGKPEKGLPQYSSTADGVTYLFTSAQHKAAFDDNPSKYEPRLGGYCAYGASRGSLIEIDPSAFQILNGQLLLQYSKGVMEKFNKDQAASLQKAVTNWMVLVEKKGK
jgi:YHS domain-containing protein